jgi:hypothetical protein
MIDHVLSDAVDEIDRYLGWEIGPYTEGELRSRIVAVRDQMDALRTELDVPPLSVIDAMDAAHVEHCELAGCSHPVLYESLDGPTYGWCARCRAVAYGGVHEGLEYRDGRIVDAETGEAA